MNHVNLVKGIYPPPSSNDSNEDGNLPPLKSTLDLFNLIFFTFTGHHALSHHLGEDFWELFPNKQTNPGRERISSYVRLLGCPKLPVLEALVL